MSIETTSLTAAIRCAPDWRLPGSPRTTPLVHLVFAAVDGLVFQQVCLEDPAAARAGVERPRALLRPLAR